MKFSRSPRRFHRLAGRTSVLATAEICEARCLLTNYSLGALTADVERSGSIGTRFNQTSDNYSFTLNEDRYITFDVSITSHSSSLTSLSFRYQHQAIGAENGGFSIPVSAGNESMTFILPAGQYSASITGGNYNQGRSATYDFGITLGAVVDDPDPECVDDSHDSIGSAGAPRYLDADDPYSLSDSVCGVDPIDYFQFRSRANGRLQVDLTDLTANANVFIENAFGTVLASSSPADTSSKQVNLDGVENGDALYIRVERVGEVSTDYNLTVELIESTPPGQPDLVGSYLSIPTGSYGPGDSFDITYRVRNAGSASVGSFAVRFYLSRDALINPNDFFEFNLGEVTHPGIASGTTAGTRTLRVTLPPASNAIYNDNTVYYIGMVLDPYVLIDESNELNNANVGNSTDRSTVSIPSVSPQSGPRTQILGFANGRWWGSGDDGSGSYQNFEITGLPAVEPRLTLTGDFNGNGRDDLAIWLPNGEWHVASVAANGTVSVSHWTTWRTTNVKEIHVGDFNDDGRDDLIGLFKQGSRNRGRWWAGLSTGSKFLNRSWGDYGNYSGIASVQVGNFDGVKGDDLTIIATSGVLWMYKTSNSRFQYLNAGRWSMSGGLSHAQTGDFNGDNRLDVVGILGSGATRRIQVAKSIGPANGFASGNWSNVTVSQSLDGVVVGDFDADGRDDVGILLNGTKVWFGDSNGQKFALQYLTDWSAAAGGISHLAAGDTNGDGRADVFGRLASGYWRSLETSSTGVTDRQLSYWGTGVTWSQVQTGYFTNTPPAPADPRSGGTATSKPSDNSTNTASVNTSRWNGGSDEPADFATQANEERPAYSITGDPRGSLLNEFAEDMLADLLAGLAITP
ncbi:CARDB domain-containing protein [Rubinisphaera margarita]|uniref:CARDB domain-containing protein n=1 Tax=Rubinisphaera margarita TaxID=2909586 RepID=UPI001EE882C4|nr:CARDB domain-containing protein [Rubinisphaera margarita]MCG6156753.1 hypothetical protein [Rubinisphaera margarita]